MAIAIASYQAVSLVVNFSEQLGFDIANSLTEESILKNSNSYDLMQADFIE